MVVESSQVKKRELRNFERRVERLASQVTSNKIFADLNLEKFVNLQRDIFNLLIDLQFEIGIAKRSNRDGHDAIYLQALRGLRWTTRRLGDAVAWNVLLFDRQVIQSLGGNSLTPVPSSWSDGHRGMFEFVERSTSSGWGLPIVHDITSILRVGDVTFMIPSDDAAEQNAIFRTVELKTTRLSEERMDDGQTVLQVRVTAISNEPIPGSTQSASDAQTISASEKYQHIDKRIDRQLRRMDLARARKNAPLHESAKVGEEHIFKMWLDDEEDSHWIELRRAIRLARNSGYAYFQLGGFVGYSLFYNDSRVSVSDITNSPMHENVVSLQHSEIGNRNSITICQLPDDDKDSWSGKALPFFLWQIPKRALQDMLSSRLMIVATYNSGWMEKLLVDAGLTVVPTSGGNDKREFKVVASISWANEADVEYHSQVWEEIFVAVHEFRGPRAVVQRASAILSVPATTALEKFLPLE